MKNKNKSTEGEKVVIKIGSRLITKNSGKLDKKNLSRLVEEIAKLRKNKISVALVSSGAVSCGRVNERLRGKFKVSGLDQTKDILREQVLASIGQPELMAFYKKEFRKYNLECAQILVTRDDFADRGRYLNLRTTIFNLLNLGIVPIFNENDVLSTIELDFSDNDQLACMVAGMLVADRLLILTNVDGVYDKDPDNPKAKILKEINNVSEVLESVSTKKSGVGKGGMRSKLMSASMIMSMGIPLNIANGFRENVIYDILLRGENPGTFFISNKKKIKPIKVWMSIAAGVKGKIIVSNFIADILKEKKPASILLLGVEKVEGDFDKREIIEICNEQGERLGKGQVKINSEELRREIKLYKKNKQKNIQCESGKMIIVHYDYFTFY